MFFKNDSHCVHIFVCILLASFDDELAGWNVSKVTNFQDLFFGASTFGTFAIQFSETSIKNWNTAAAVNMLGMFEDAK